MIETETIGCPACRVEQDVDVYQTINAMENPELLQKLMAGEIKIGLGYNALLQADLTHNESVRYSRRKRSGWTCYVKSDR